MHRFIKSRIALSQILFAGAVLLFLSACNDQPTQIGYSFISDTVAVHTISSEDSTIILSAEDFYSHGQLVNSGALFIGKTADITTASVIRFSGMPDTLFDLKESDIISATLNMYPGRYAIGDTVNGQLGFKIKKVPNPWTVKATWDTIQAPGFTENEVLGSFSGKIKLKDSMDIVSIDISKKIISDWTARRSDTNSHVVNWGIALLPDDNNTVINSFSAEAIGSSGVIKSSYIKVIYFNTAKNAKDTMTLTSAVDAAFMSKPSLEPGYINVQAGYINYSVLKFDVTSIPKYAGIHKAQFEMTLAPEKCRVGNYGYDKVIRLDLQNTPTDSLIQNYYFAAPVVNDTLTYAISSIASSVEYWTRHDGGKGLGKGMLVIKSSDFQSSYRELDKMVFYGPSYPDKSKRPKLKIIYSKQIQTKK